MKKLLVALILAVILTATLATPAFAAGPPDQLPDKARDVLELLITRQQGKIGGYGWGGWCYPMLYSLLYGGPPAKWW